ncbi:hypothetical protein MBM_08335 [Drepanopeziza brunnea f. sp. 'multigermtubi' MB_m1]|uniref:Uncharacterized protein n=1 Tax=Marssonina brunnea f. sp. multigermtubi (strain MB_m1) TaxID=1072389 RepID=K1WMR6_MARBU|nr:uncharacterized protein MBM_08335 [Drepanopeziza brunnea f. sp. 'multigermtubi' MB_m1]EKD13617.1 hypothetical protein MBM_08335 [Drepanopeziza brunnea f. sp. 'multigermtubi' MB_m1]
MGSAELLPLPYWQVNVPPSERTDECPVFLRDLKPTALINHPLSNPISQPQPLTPNPKSKSTKTTKKSRSPPLPQTEDILILSTPDSQYQRLTWPQVQSITASNALAAFQRVPSDLRRYLAYSHALRQTHGSVMNFVVRERLGWALPVVAEGGGGGVAPFEREGDVKILWNDWPYGVDERIVHL